METPFYGQTPTMPRKRVPSTGAGFNDEAARGRIMGHSVESYLNDPGGDYRAANGLTATRAESARDRASFQSQIASADEDETTRAADIAEETKLRLAEEARARADAEWKAKQERERAEEERRARKQEIEIQAAQIEADRKRQEGEASKRFEDAHGVPYDKTLAPIILKADQMDEIDDDYYQTIEGLKQWLMAGVDPLGQPYDRKRFDADSMKASVNRGLRRNAGPGYFGIVAPKLLADDPNSVQSQMEAARRAREAAAGGTIDNGQR